MWYCSYQYIQPYDIPQVYSWDTDHTDLVTFTILTKDNKEISCDEARRTVISQTAELQRVTT
jgi:hypothetical protein